MAEGVDRQQSHAKDSDVRWQNAFCHLCGAASGEAITLHGKPLTRGQFGYEVHPVICRCGLVYLTPRWSAADYTHFYVNHYDDLYRLETKPDYGLAGVTRHMAQVWQRVAPHLPQQVTSGRVLDVGCGSGHGLRYLMERLPTAEFYGIEASPECCRLVQEEVGATLLDRDVDGPWLEQNQGRFDLIIMRHVVEHFLAPVETLSRLRSALAPGGVMYIAVPDMMHPRTVLRDYDKWWEYWFRAVHPYYYSKETLFATLALAGFHGRIWGEEVEEVWCLVETTESKAPDWQGNSAAQRAVLDQLLPS